MRIGRSLVISLFAVLALCFLPAAASKQPGDQVAKVATGAIPQELPGRDTDVDLQIPNVQICDHPGEWSMFELFVIFALVLLFDVLLGGHSTKGMHRS